MVREHDFVAAVAGDPATARRAVAAIDAEWDVPPPGPRDVVAHLRAHPVAEQGWERKLDEAVGDVDAALATAVQQVDATYTTAYLAHVPLETRAAIAEWDGDRLTVWVGTQVPYGVRNQLADELGLEEGDVRVIVPPTGGGFGGKHDEEVALEAARLARGVGRAVKVRWNRAEEFQWGHLRPMAVIDVRAGTDATGSITAWDFARHQRRGRRHRPPVQDRQPSSALPARGLPRRPDLLPGARRGRQPLRPGVGCRRAGPRRGPRPARIPPPQPGRRTARRGARHRRRPIRLGGRPSGTAQGKQGAGMAVGLEKGGHVATFARVRVENDRSVRVTEIVTAYECGAVVNRDTVINQIEGGTIMALGGALFEEMVLEGGRIVAPSLAAYRVPRFSDVPRLEVVLVDRPDIPSAGAGETPLVAVAPAIANAIFAAIGRRLRSLPLAPAARKRRAPDA